MNNILHNFTLSGFQAKEGLIMVNLGCMLCLISFLLAQQLC